ncbi:MAG: hypothetical protein A2174_00180 [Candidatus Portnoybacteria bacterium RBG_13_41_18]|uniref:Uncharacterized protein n=1 Tax=Candidatus Portnoybacteria bacterium RBG_13_41_18 TaxID=1801991 RepID=A0A1G2F557_9BACT|nr:MAG: hypothetical protein A2174_00180 [Candidatus Portnoybacteria bacterium RBG_13_41_18]
MAILGIYFVYQNWHLFTKKPPVFINKIMSVDFIGKTPPENSQEHKNLVIKVQMQTQMTLGQFDQAMPISGVIHDALKTKQADPYGKINLAAKTLMVMGYINCRHLAPPLYIIAQKFFPEKDVVFAKGKIKGGGRDWESHTWIEIGEKIIDDRHIGAGGEKYQYKDYLKSVFIFSENGVPKEIKVKYRID